MSEQTTITEANGVATLYCTHCGRPMRIAAGHVNTTVACPHCSEHIDPWRVASPRPTPPPQSAPPPSPPPPPPILESPGFAPPLGQRRAEQYGIHGETVPTGYSWRNRWVAGALGVLLGSFGVHRFYLGSNGIGMTQVLLTVCSLFVLLPVVAVWGFIEGILCFVGAMHDVDGLPLGD